jgi:uncharacterized protein DUF748
MRRRGLIIAATAVLVVVLLALGGLRALDEPLRRRMEAQVNASLTGYRVGIGALRLHLLGGSVDLLDGTIAQTAHPDPPIARVPRLHASVHWGALLHGALVADFWFDSPVLNIDVRQATTEMHSKTPIKEKGWQQAAESIYPLKINLVRVTNADVTYTPDRPFGPLHMRKANLIADNIRNVHSRDQTYPSDLHVDAWLFDSAELRVDGNADFLAEPYAGVRAYVSAQQIPLAYLTPILARWASINNGTLSTDGTLEYGPRVARVDLRDLLIDGVEGWYVRTRENQAEEQQATEKSVEAAGHASDNPNLQLHAGRIHVQRSTLGVVNKAADPPYAVYLTDATLDVHDFTNQRAEGPSAVEVHGSLMGSRSTTVRTTFHPRPGRPDFDTDVDVEDIDLPTMNDMLKATAGFDVAEGKLSLYSELHVRDKAIQGYVKPVVKGLRVTAPEKDRDKSIGEKLHEHLIGGVASVMKNQLRDEIATRTDLSGPVTAPETSTLQIVLGVLENAYFKAIVPGLEKARNPEG